MQSSHDPQKLIYLVDHHAAKTQTRDMPRTPVLQQVERDHAGLDPVRWKALAMSYLRHVCDWPVECIALCFDHPRGHVSRLIRQGDALIRISLRGEQPKNDTAVGEDARDIEWEATANDHETPVP